MTINFQTMQDAIREAKTTIAAVDEVATEMCGLMVGRLRKVRSTTYLRLLKKELANFDMTTGRWKP